MIIRPRRSVLYMPGSNARALEKAKSLPVDGLILDLEDAVAPEAKTEARERICEAVAAREYGKREVTVRINALDSQWGEADLAAVAKAGPDAVVLPKVNCGEDIEAASAALDALSAGDTVGLWAMMETPMAILSAREIAATAATTRLRCFVMGTNDLAKEIGGRLQPDRTPFLGMLGTCILAAKAHGLAILDGVFNDLGNGDGFAAECAAGRDFGFDGKTLIHPDQIAACNEAFAPSSEELARAAKIVEAFDLPENRNKGAIRIDGQMVELLHAEVARRTQAIAIAIENMAGDSTAD